MSSQQAAIPSRRTSSDSTIHNHLDGSDGEKGQSKAVDSDQSANNTPANPTDPTSSAKDGLLPSASAAAPSPQPDDPEASRTRLETALIVLALCLALFLAALDTTIVATAVPTISRHFNSSAGYVWIGSAYLFGNAAAVPAWGKLSDIFGRKPAVLSAVSVFWVGSLLCAVSVNMGMLIAARAIQGVGAGGLMSLPNICVSDLFSVRKRGMYFGIFGIVWAVAGGLGPILGGAFSAKVSWRWCFYINLPLGGIAMVILIFFLNLHNPRTPLKQGLAAIDWVGNLLVIGGTLMFLFGLEFGGVSHPWSSPIVICLIVFGVFTLGLCTIWEGRFAKYPVIPNRLFNSKTNVAAFVSAVLSSMTFMTGSYWLPLYFQAVVGVGSLLSGVYILAYAFALSLSAAAGGIIIKNTGQYKLPIVLGFISMTLGFGLFVDLGSKTNWAKIIIFQLIAGVGMGPNFQGPLISIQNSIEPRDIAAASSTYQFLRQLGTSCSVVIGGVIFNNEMQDMQPELIQELGAQLANAFSGANAPTNVFIIKTLSSHQAQIVKDVYWIGLRSIFIYATVTSFVGMLFALLIKQRILSTEHKEYKTGLQSLKQERQKTTDPETADSPQEEATAEKM